MAIRACAQGHPAFHKLWSYYRDRTAHLRECQASGKPVVGKLGFGVCDELILAAGMESLAVSPDASFPRDLSDRYLEYSFTEKGKVLFSMIASGDRARLPDYVVLADSEDVMNRLYYYLRELKRTEPERGLPELYLADWLYARHPRYLKWNEKVLERFAVQLEAWSGTGITEEALRKAIALYNRQHAAVSSILLHRSGARPRVTGSEALVILGARDYMDKGSYTRCVEELAASVETWPEIPGIRLFFSGSVQSDLTVYEWLEENGFHVCGEDHDGGMGVFDRAIRTGLPPVQALAEHYTMGLPRAQKGLVKDRVDSLMKQIKTAGAAAVLFWHDAYDEAGSWEYPSMKAALDKAGFPCLNAIKQPYPPVFGPSLLDGLAELKRRTGG